jgi:serine/threonine protein kinase
MADVAEQSVCPECGSTLTPSVGCMPCQLRVGFEAGADDGASDDDAPEQLANYRIARRDDGTPWELGRGSMGITYRALDLSLNRPVAIKIVAPVHAGGNSAARERFLREARVAAQLRHPNIATVYQFGVDEDTGHFFYAMELVEGETLEERVRRTGPLDTATTIAIARQVVDALALAEKNALVHRDLKPANVMLVASDAASAAPVVKIIDFGLAKALTATTDPTSLTQGGFVGTPTFASPEQFSSATLDIRSDVYSLGITLWFALTGKTPFRGRTTGEIRQAQESGQLPIDQLRRARVPQGLIALLRKMLALEPAERPGTRALAAQLEGLATTSRTGRRLIVLASAAAIAVSLAAIFWFAQRPGASPRPSAPGESAGTSNSAAAEAYLKGIYIWNTRDGSRFPEAEKYLRRAIALDPNYARAYAGLSDVLQWMALPATRVEKFAEASRAAHKALELDPGLAEAHAALGLIAMNYNWDWAGAEREFQSAIALNPQYPTGHHWYAELLGRLGRFDQALREFNLAIQLHPTLAVLHHDIGRILTFAHRYQEADLQLHEALTLNPNYGEGYFTLAQTHAQQGRFEEAFAELKELERLGPNAYTSGLSAYVYGLANDHVAAQQLLAQTQARLVAEDDMLPLIYAYVGVGDKDKALTYLERDCDIHATTMTSLRVGPHFDSLRSDPRFQTLLRRVHFSP